MLSLREALDLNSKGLLPIEKLREMPREEQEHLARELIQTRALLQNEKQIIFYRPVSAEARKIHLSTAKEVIAVGGNRSSKTDTSLADMTICMTGIIPLSLENDYPKEKIFCPGRVRLTVESLTNTWEPVIKPKLQWNQWNGRGEPGGSFGHWGWIPREFLIKGKWDESWSEKNRTLTLSCGCTLQIMSYDQDLGNFSGGSFHLCVHDEGPPEDIYRENKMRTLDTKGRLMIAFTPPDDESSAWQAAWVFDSLYEKGLPGPAKDPNIDSFTLFTEDNRILDSQSIQDISRGLTLQQKEVRLRGKFIHLSGLIYPQFAKYPRNFCFTCNDIVLLVEGNCGTCGGRDVTTYANVIEPVEFAYRWPIVYLLDPHPRKDNMMIWVAIDPLDDPWQVAEMAIDGEPETVRNKVFQLERDLGLNVVSRLIDPNMAESPAHSAGRRHVTVRDEFDAVGLRCKLANDAFDVGKNRLRALLRPDLKTRNPHSRIFNTCHKTIYQFEHYVWSEWSRYSAAQKDPKPIPQAKNDDFPTLHRYLANENVTYAGLMAGREPVRRPGRVGAY